MSERLYALIMAGGSGTRFWPLSRQRTPKHLLNVIGGNSLLQETYARVARFIPPQRILVITNRQQRRLITRHLSNLDPACLILEPSPRNTAPCIGLAAFHIYHRDPDAILITLPSDHLIEDHDKFKEAIERAVETVKRTDGLVTFGITPSRPETGYGYIQIERQGEPDLPQGVFRVRTFAEKPNLETARRFLESGDFFWNSGMFVWRAERILKELEEHQPEIYHLLTTAFQHWGTNRFNRILLSGWSSLRPISIDYGVMEVTRSPIYMVKGEFNWSDVGSWDAIYRLKAQRDGENVAIGEAIFQDCRSSLIYSPDHLIALIGMEETLVVHTPDATLICPLTRAQEVKQVVERLQRENRDHLL